MTYTITTIHPDSRTESRETDTKLTLKEMQDVVGGLIQIVPDFTTFRDKPCIAFVNEEGLLEGLDYNPAATLAWRVDLERQMPGQWVPDMAHLVGPVLIIAAEDRDALDAF